MLVSFKIILIKLIMWVVISGSKSWRSQKESGEPNLELIRESKSFHFCTSPLSWCSSSVRPWYVDMYRTCPLDLSILAIIAGPISMAGPSQQPGAKLFLGLWVFGQVVPELYQCIKWVFYKWGYVYGLAQHNCFGYLALEFILV